MTKATRPEPTEIDYARLAAYIDGEGHISIQKNSRSWFVQINIHNTDPRMIEWLYRTFGGFIGAHHWNNKQKAKWRSTLKWYLCNAHAHEALMRCLPYFVSKKDQAEIAISFRQTIRRVGVKGHPEEIYKTRQEMRAQLKLLRHREYPREELDAIAQRSKSPRAKAG